MNLVGMRSRHHHVAVQADFGAVLVHVGSQSSPCLPPSRQGGDPQRHCPSLTPSSPPPLPPLLRHRVHSHTHPTAAAAARVAECRKGLERERVRAAFEQGCPAPFLLLRSICCRSVGRSDGRTAWWSLARPRALRCESSSPPPPPRRCSPPSSPVCVPTHERRGTMAREGPFGPPRYWSAVRHTGKTR